MLQKIEITGNDDGRRVDRFLRKKFVQIPLSALYKLLRKNQIRLFRHGKKQSAKKDELLHKGDQLWLYFDPLKFGATPEKKTPNFEFLTNSKFYKEHLQICYEDEYFFVADKKAGIAVHPGSKTPWGRSLIDLFVAKVDSKDANAPEPKLAHRLDKNTSGLLIISKNDATLRKLTALIREGGMQKKYLALVRGKLAKKEGSIDSKLLRTEGLKYTKIRVSGDKAAKDSRTFFSVRKYYQQLDASLLEVILDTGRMHQIRVHFSSEGHPLAADDVYGERTWNRELRKKYRLERQFLHAHQLEFVHPETGQLVTFTSELPLELKNILPS